MCMVLQSGMAFKDADHESGFTYVCLCNLRWAVLAWPLVELQDGLHILDPDGRLSWHFVLKNDAFQAAIMEPSLVPGVGIACKISEWNPPVRVLLRFFSEQLVFRDLEFLAKSLFDMKKTGSKTRADLLKELATEVGGRDFAEEVLESVKFTRQRKVDETDFDELADLLLEAMDKDEATEFSDIKTFLSKKKKTEVAQRWQKWKREAGKWELK